VTSESPPIGRRAAVAGLLSLGVLGSPLGLGAQPAGRVPRIGIIVEPANEPFLPAFQQGLKELGYVEDKGIAIEYRHVGTALDRVPDLAGELVRLKVDLLVVPGTVAARLARDAATSVPIVFVTAGDPVGSGLVTSLGRPGGNATGLSVLVPDIAGKHMQLLKTTVPRLSRVTVLSNPENSTIAKSFLASAREAGRAIGVEVQGVVVRKGGLESTLSPMTTRGAGALMFASDPLFGAELAQISRLCARNRLPAIYNRREFADAGGLMAYGPSFADNYRRAAVYVDKILKGAKPAELPVEQPTKFELVINLKTAKAFGLAVPASLVSRADDVIR
jgi:putative ABC transport system substrate-binding protein